MKLGQFNSFCKSLPHTAHVVQWGGAHVWKVGGATGKMFAIGWPEPDGMRITFKVTPLAYDILKQQEGLIPAPYLASRGMTWIQRVTDASMDDAALKEYLRESHRLAAENLPKAMQKKLGLLKP
jgi:predicted DNA-binding protein (MmcQ/YjbR family)